MQTNTEQLSNKSSLTLGFCLKILVHWHGWLDFACVKDTLYQVNTWNLNINDLLLFSFLIFVCLTGHVTKRSVSSTSLIDYTSRLINSAAQIIFPIIFFFVLLGLYFVYLLGLDIFMELLTETVHLKKKQSLLLCTLLPMGCNEIPDNLMWISSCNNIIYHRLCAYFLCQRLNFLLVSYSSLMFLDKLGSTSFSVRSWTVCFKSICLTCLVERFRCSLVQSNDCVGMLLIVVWFNSSFVVQCLHFYDCSKHCLPHGFYFFLSFVLKAALSLTKTWL